MVEKGLGGGGVVEVEVEDNEACPGGVSLRFKRAGEAREIERVRFESDDGLEGLWKVVGMASDDGRVLEPARAVLVEDSSEGETLLVLGGAYGIRLEHEDTGRVVREPYLVLERNTPVG